MADRILQECVDHLRELPFVTGHRIVHEVRMREGQALDALLKLDLLDDRAVELAVEIKRTNLTHALARALAARAEKVQPHPLLVVAPRITRGVGEQLREQKINYVDTAGNCWVEIDGRFVARIEGRRPPKPPPQGRGLGAAGYQVLFALLALPDPEQATVRDIAGHAGVALGTVTGTLERLEQEGLILRGRGRVNLLERQDILERWVHGYSDQVRPRLLLGQFRTIHTDPGEREEGLAQILDQHREIQWAWGGGAGAMLLTGYYHGPHTVLCVDEPPDDLPVTLGALRDDDGPLIVLRAPGDLFLNGPKAHVAHPAWIYAELLATRDERAREAAEELRREYLE